MALKVMMHCPRSGLPAATPLVFATQQDWETASVKNCTFACECGGEHTVSKPDLFVLPG